MFYKRKVLSQKSLSSRIFKNLNYSLGSWRSHRWINQHSHQRDENDSSVYQTLEERFRDHWKSCCDFHRFNPIGPIIIWRRQIPPIGEKLETLYAIRYCMLLHLNISSWSASMSFGPKLSNSRYCIVQCSWSLLKPEFLCYYGTV